jgi:hypothetical protein
MHLLLSGQAWPGNTVLQIHRKNNYTENKWLYEAVPEDGIVVFLGIVLKSVEF